MNSHRSGFIAEHRGGPLSKNQHTLLMTWARNCILHVLPQVNFTMNEVLNQIMKISKDWEIGESSVGETRNASLKAINLARELNDPVSIEIIRGIGQMVAVAHMADHAIGSAEYALSALTCKGKAIDSEREWQNDQLPLDIKILVLTAREQKKKFWQGHRKKLLLQTKLEFNVDKH